MKGLELKEHFKICLGHQNKDPSTYIQLKKEKAKLFAHHLTTMFLPIKDFKKGHTNVHIFAASLPHGWSKQIFNYLLPCERPSKELCLI